MSLARRFAVILAITLLVAGSRLQRTAGKQCAYKSHHSELGNDHVIQGHYIVHFEPNHTLSRHQEFIGRNLSFSEDLYELRWLPGYSAQLDEHTLHELVRRDPGVRLVENNLRKHLIEPVYRSDSEPTLNNSINTLDKRYFSVQLPESPWNLQMISASGKLPTPVKKKGNYLTLKYSGAGVNVYILDTGIRTTHKSFGGRATNFKGMKWSPYAGETMDDLDGHGTHVAGIVGAISYGVAQWSTMVNVKVIGKNGASDDKIADAIHDIVAEHNSLKTKPSTPDGYLWRGGVINMSFSGPGYSDAFEKATRDALTAGLTMVVAAGNENKDARGAYPCAFNRFTGIQCVASVDNSYKKSWFSNYGDNIELVAPGSDIESLGIKSDVDTVKMSGTSMAAPHVAGIIANVVYWEGLNQDHGSAISAALHMLWQGYWGIVKGFNPIPKFASSGIQNPDKKFDEPVGDTSCHTHAKVTD